MDTTRTELDGFERSVKESLEHYEVPYNSADWAQLEERLAQRENLSRTGSAGLLTVLFAGTVALAASAYLLMQDPLEGHGGMAITEHATVVQGTGEVGALPTVTEGTTPTEGAAAMANSSEPTATTPETGVARTRTDRPERATSTTSEQRTAVIEVDAPSTSIGKGGTSGTTGPAELVIRPSITEGCPGTVIDFSLTNAPEEGIFLWNFGDGSFSNKPSPTHTFTKSGTFEVMLSVSAVGGGSFSNKPAADQIVIHEAPEAQFTPVKRIFENTIPSVHFQNRSIGGKTYHWDFGDGSTSTVVHPDHVFKKAGTYTVVLTVTNARGCVDRTERTVRVDDDYDLMAPRTLSPDGDGIEDTFIPEALRTLGVRFHMGIYDSVTGQLLFETTDASRPWNGRVGNKGSLCPAGEYVWMVEMKDGEKLGGTYTGKVNLLR
jgi:hypothetical protein